MKILVCAAGFLIMIVIGGCDFMSHTRCDDKILAQRKSADGKVEIILYQRSCANNTGLYTCADLAATSDNLSGQKERQTILTMRGFHDIAATWTGPESVEIKSPGLRLGGDTLTQENKWKSIHITYKE